MLAVPSDRSCRFAPRPTLILALSLLLGFTPAGLAQGGDGGVDSGSVGPEEQAAETIARLTVIPAGEQAFDLATGETTLPDGGTIIDRQTGLTLRAERIVYRDGDYIHAWSATAETDAGVLTAPTLRIDVPSLTARVPDGVTLERPGLAVTADSAEYLFEESLVRFHAPRGTSTTLEARTLYLAVDTGDVLLIGPYLYQDGPFTLRDERADSALQLRPVTADDGTTGYRAANEVDPDLWARVAPPR